MQAIKKVFETLNTVLNAGYTPREVETLYSRFISVKKGLEKTESELGALSETDLNAITRARSIDAGVTVSKETDDLIEEIANYIDYGTLNP